MRARESHIFAKERHGHYVEPVWCSARLFEEENFGPRGSLILDPACGWGHCLTSARAHGFKTVGLDVVDRGNGRPGLFYQRNFLKDKIPPSLLKCSSIVCNPPFNHVEEFCRLACTIARRKVAMLILLRRLPAAHWLDDLPLESVYLLTPRPSMPPGKWILAGNKPGGGTQDFAWLVFNLLEHPQRRVRVRWLHRDGELVDLRRAAE